MTSGCKFIAAVRVTRTQIRSAPNAGKRAAFPMPLRFLMHCCFPALLCFPAPFRPPMPSHTLQRACLRTLRRRPLQHPRILLRAKKSRMVPIEVCAKAFSHASFRDKASKMPVQAFLNCRFAASQAKPRLRRCHHTHYFCPKGPSKIAQGQRCAYNPRKKKDADGRVVFAHKTMRTLRDTGLERYGLCAMQTSNATAFA